MQEVGHKYLRTKQGREERKEKKRKITQIVYTPPAWIRKGCCCVSRQGGEHYVEIVYHKCGFWEEASYTARHTSHISV